MILVVAKEKRLSRDLNDQRMDFRDLDLRALVLDITIYEWNL